MRMEIDLCIYVEYVGIYALYSCMRIYVKEKYCLVTLHYFI